MNNADKNNLLKKIEEYFNLSVKSSGVFNSGDSRIGQTYVESIINNNIGKEVCQLALASIKDKAKARVIDLGCGLGGFVLACQQQGLEAIGVEIDPQAAEIARLRINNPDRIVLTDGKNLNFPAEFFDLATSITVIEHVENPLQYLQEVHRVLKAGGSLILFAPNYLFPWEGHYKLFWPPYFLPYTKSLFKLYLRAKGRDQEFTDHINFKITPGYLTKTLTRAGFSKIENISLYRFEERIKNPDLINNPGPRELLKKLKRNPLTFFLLKLGLPLSKISRLYHPMILLAYK